MRKFCLIAMSLFVVGILLTMAVIYKNASTFALHRAGMAQWSAKLLDHDTERWAELKTQALARARLYEDLTRENHLLQGMVIIRNAEGEARDLCDSLLFSNLRYVALQKLGWHDEADQAWRAISRSRKGDQWLRHPDCHLRLSRDMIIGLLAAYTTKPKGYENQLRSLVSYLERHRGFIGDGPFYVSYLSPGLAAITRSLAIGIGMNAKELPLVLRYGYSTLELDSLGGQLGYQSHLNAMVVWIEQEIAKGQQDGKAAAIPNLPRELSPLMGAITGYRMEPDRLNWVTYRLFASDPDNLFFRFLYLRSIGSLTLPVKIRLLQTLLAMPQFPTNRLPTSCDRNADYLWQRVSSEYYQHSQAPACDVYHGVDFLWMVANLLSE